MLYCSPIGGVKGNIEARWGRPSTAWKCLFEEKNENFQEKSFFPPVTRRARSPPPHILTLPLLQPLCKIWSSLRMSGSPTHIHKQVRLGTWLGLMMTTMMAMRILMILTTVKTSRHTEVESKWHCQSRRTFKSFLIPVSSIMMHSFSWENGYCLILG